MFRKITDIEFYPGSGGSYQHIDRKSKDSYYFDWAVNDKDANSNPLNFNHNEDKDGYKNETEGDYYATLPKGYVCVCYTAGKDSLERKCDCR